MRKMILLLSIVVAARARAQERRIEVKASEFVHTRFLSPEQIQDTRKRSLLRGIGEADYRFQVPKSGWYELWVLARKGPTDLYLDGRFLIHTPFDSGVWEPAGKYKNIHKVMNLYLDKGQHTLRFSRLWRPGFSYIRSFYLEPARDITGMVRLLPSKDYLVFRKGEHFEVQLKAGRQVKPVKLILSITDVRSGEVVNKIEKTVSAGTGVYEEQIAVPTRQEGTFDLLATDDSGRAVARIIQYLVIDTERKPRSERLRKELVFTIDCSKQEPDYSLGTTRVVRTSCGRYRESGIKGRCEYAEQASFFGYKLRLPSTQELYLIEVDYPDDDQRTFTISVYENSAWSYSLDGGVVCGGVYRLSNKMKTYQMFFWPRDVDPRIVFLNWHTGQRAGASRVRVYRVSGLPPLTNTRDERLFGLYSEEPLRYTCFFGAMPEGNNWLNLSRSAERLGRWSEHIGANLWLQTIAVYQATLWPAKTIPGYGPDDEWVHGLAGPITLKSPFKNDIMRLMLLTCEKHGMKFIGELHIPANAILMRYLDKRFGGKGTTEDDGPHKPWLIVSKDGKVGEKSYYQPYYNPLYPGVQDWVGDVVSELAERYKDSPAFSGVAIRLLAWAFSSWQCLPSINWGYGDYTIRLFEKETGIKVPVPDNGPDRFHRRYEWLVCRCYDRWVEWRCRKIVEYHKRLARILSRARGDLKLYINAFGPHYARGDYVGRKKIEGIILRHTKGWLKTIRETGVDPRLYRDEPNIVFSDNRVYPAGIRSYGADAMYRASAQRDEVFDPTPISLSSKPAGVGVVSAVRLCNQYMEGWMPAKLIDLSDRTPAGRKRERVIICGVLNPPGRHFLRRYANALADGNITLLTDGGLGYILGQPEYLREFIGEYRALPVIGMERLNDDPVALWYGEKEGKWYLYLVNRTDFAVRVTLRFEGRASLRRLSTRKRSGRKLWLKSYELRSFESATRPVSVEVKAPEWVKEELESQLHYVEELLGDVSERRTVPFSTAELERAKETLERAKRALEKRRYWSAKRFLMGHKLVRIYELLGSYPPRLFARRVLAKPEGALSPRELLKRAEGEARMLPGEKLDAELTGEEVLIWKRSPLVLRIEQKIPNRYRVSYASVVRKPFAPPSISIKRSEYIEKAKNQLWVERTLQQPLSLGAGSRTLKLLPQKGRRVALLYLYLEPIYRDTRASEWLVVGAFPSKPRGRKCGEGMDTIFPPEKDRNPSALYEFDGKKLRWVRPGFDSDYVDLFKVTGAFNHRVSYAMTIVESPEERPAEVKFGVDYWARIWLNGEKVFEITGGHSAPHKGEFTFPIKLRKGLNELFLKINAGSAGNGFWLSISDPGDLKIYPPGAK